MLLKKMTGNFLCSVVQMKNLLEKGWQCHDLRLAFQYEISKDFSSLVGFCLKKVAESSWSHRHSKFGMYEARSYPTLEAPPIRTLIVSHLYPG